MPTHEYRFTTRWQVQGTPEEIFPILDDAPGLVRWWPAVYLGVQADSSLYSPLAPHSPVAK